MNRNLEDEQGPIPASINILDVARGVLRRRTLVVGVTALALAAALCMVKLMKPAFTTEAQVLVGNLETPFDRIRGNDAVPASGPSADSREIDTQIAVLRSADLGRRVVAALHLADDPHYNALLDGLSKAGAIKLILGFGEDPRLKTPEQRALDSYDKGLVVYQVPNSDVVAIKVNAAVPATAAAVANTLAETYVAYTRESEVQPTERARQWLAQQIDELRRKVAASDSAVEKFRSAAGLLQGTNSTLGAQELSELNSQITLAEAAKTDSRSRADSIRALLAREGTVDASADVLASAVIQGLKLQQTEAAKSVAELSAVYLSNHPKMIAARRQLDDINRRIRSEAQKIVDGLEGQARIAEAREASLRARLDGLKGKASSANLDDVKLKALEREAQANRNLLETMLARYAEATARLDPAAQPGHARVIETAGVPSSPSFPKPGPTVLLVTIAGFCLSLGLAFLLEIMAAAARLNDRMVRASHAADAAASPQRQPEVQTQSVAPAVPAWQPPPVPLAPLAEFLPAGSADAAQPPGAVDAVLDWYAGEKRLHGASTLAVASIGAAAADGPAAAVALARRNAGHGRRTIVIDLSADAAALPQLCGVAAGQGLTDLVAGTADFTRIIARDSRSPAHVMRYGIDRSDATRALLRDRLAPVLAALSQSYDTILVNLGEAGGDAPAMLRLCQSAVFLAPAGRAADVSAIIAALAGTGFKAVRFVLIGEPATVAEAAPALAANG